MSRMAGLVRSACRRWATVRIGIPRRGGDAVELAAKRIKRGILELSEKTLAELVPVQARAGHSLAGRQPRHRLAPGLAATHARGCEIGVAQSRFCGLDSRRAGPQP